MTEERTLTFIMRSPRWGWTTDPPESVDLSAPVEAQVTLEGDTWVLQAHVVLTALQGAHSARIAFMDDQGVELGFINFRAGVSVGEYTKLGPGPLVRWSVT